MRTEKGIIGSIKTFEDNQFQPRSKVDHHQKWDPFESQRKQTQAQR